MSNQFYPKGLDDFAGAGDWSNAGLTYTAMLVDTSVYTFSSAHNFYSDLSGAIAGSNIVGRTVSGGGKCFGSNNVFYNISGNVGAIVIFRDTGLSTTSPLILFIDSSPNLPMNGLVNAEVDINWDGVNGICRI